MGLIAWKALSEGATAAAMPIGGRRVPAYRRSRDLSRGLVHALACGLRGIGSVEIGKFFLAVCRGGEAVFPWAGGLRGGGIAGGRSITIGVFT